MPADDRLPVVLGAFDADLNRIPVDAVVVGLNDHHAFVRVPADTPLVPGTILSVGISHPCGAFDRWRQIPIVNADRRIIGVAEPQL